MPDETAYTPTYTPPDPRPNPEPDPEPEPAADPLLVIDPVLMDTLASLDRDVSGEQKFCAQAAEALRAFQARWTSDLAVEDGYGSAIQALDNMRSILDGAQTRWTQEVTRQVLGRQEAARRQEYARQEREHAMAWAETPPPVPEKKASTAADEPRPGPVPPEAGVVA